MHTGLNYGAYEYTIHIISVGVHAVILEVGATSSAHAENQRDRCQIRSRARAMSKKYKPGGCCEASFLGTDQPRTIAWMSSKER